MSKNEINKGLESKILTDDEARSFIDSFGNYDQLAYFVGNSLNGIETQLAIMDREPKASREQIEFHMILESGVAPTKEEVERRFKQEKMRLQTMLQNLKMINRNL